MFGKYKAFPLSLNEWTVQEYLSFMSTDQVDPWPQPECRITNFFFWTSEKFTIAQLAWHQQLPSCRQPVLIEQPNPRQLQPPIQHQQRQV